MKTAKEALEEIEKSICRNSLAIEKFQYKLQNAIENGETKFILDVSLTEEEETYIEGLGYTLVWSRACLWYDVYIRKE